MDFFLITEARLSIIESTDNLLKALTASPNSAHQSPWCRSFKLVFSAHVWYISAYVMLVPKAWQMQGLQLRLCHPHLFEIHFIHLQNGSFSGSLWV